MRSLERAPTNKFKARFTIIGDAGTLRTPDLLREVSTGGKPKIFEIKVDHGPGYRLYVIRRGAEWYATHGGPKPKKRKVAAEVTRARDYFAAGGGSE